MQVGQVWLQAAVAAAAARRPVAPHMLTKLVRQSTRGDASRHAATAAAVERGVGSRAIGGGLRVCSGGGQAAAAVSGGRGRPQPRTSLAASGSHAAAVRAVQALALQW